MSRDAHPRYVILEQTRELETGRGGLVCFILDRWDCYREVDVIEGGLRDPLRRTRYLIRRDAKRALDRWNAEHDAWLASPS